MRTTELKEFRADKRTGQSGPRMFCRRWDLSHGFKKEQKRGKEFEGGECHKDTFGSGKRFVMRNKARSIGWGPISRGPECRTRGLA